jgi:poly-gamma-glutamate synthesis protein (capsule biosynthesis protein)
MIPRAALAVGVAAVLAVGAYVPTSDVSAPFWTPPPTPISVMFGGDIMLDRNVARSAEASTTAYLFEDIAPVFTDADLRVANLEGTITTNPSVARQNNKILRFTFDPTIAGQALRVLQLDAVSLANNHALDFYQAGYTSTREYLSGFGVGYFGHPLNAAGTLSTTLLSGGKTFCLVGYHSLFDADTTSVVAEIQTLRPQCSYVIVLPHWGEEYDHVAHAGQREAAYAFIDAGADVVVGGHPHVVQGHEVYRGKAIFYSLGNFMFDQNFSWATTRGMLLRVEFDEAKTHFEVIPILIKDQKVSLATGEDAQKIIDLVGVAQLTLP